MQNYPLKTMSTSTCTYEETGELIEARKEAEATSKKVWATQHDLQMARKALLEAKERSRLAQHRLSVALDHARIVSHAVPSPGEMATEG